MGWFKKKKTEIPITELAAVLFEDVIINENAVPFPSDVQIAEDKKESFDERQMIYRIALVFLALKNQEEENTKFLIVRRELEAAFKEKLAQPEFALAIQEAMRNLNELLFSGTRKEMSWSMKWLKTIGIDVSNPAVLALFASGWMKAYVAIIKTISDLSPV